MQADGAERVVQDKTDEYSWTDAIAGKRSTCPTMAAHDASAYVPITLLMVSLVYDAYVFLSAMFAACPSEERVRRACVRVPGMANVRWWSWDSARPVPAPRSGRCGRGVHPAVGWTGWRIRKKLSAQTREFAGVETAHYGVER